MLRLWSHFDCEHQRPLACSIWAAVWLAWQWRRICVTVSRPSTPPTATPACWAFTLWLIRTTSKTWCTGPRMPGQYWVQDRKTHSENKKAVLFCVMFNHRTMHIFHLISSTFCPSPLQDEPVYHSDREWCSQRQERPEGQPGRTAQRYEMFLSCMYTNTHTNSSESQVNTPVCLLGTTPMCDDIGRHILNYGRRIPLAEWDARIDVSWHWSSSLDYLCN